MTGRWRPWRRPAAALLGASLLAGCALLATEGPSARQLDAAEAALATGELDAARHAFESVWRERPQERRALRGLVEVSLEARDGEAALVWLDRLAAAHPADEVARPAARCRALGMAAETLLRGLREQEELAAKPAKRAREIEGELARRRCRSGTPPGLRVRLLVALARQAALAGRHEAAAADFRAALAIEPGFVEATLELASLLLDRGDRTGAVAVLGEGLRTHPDDRRLIEMMVGALTGPAGPR